MVAMTLDDLKLRLLSGAVVRCENSGQKQDVIQKMIGMGFLCSQTMRESVDMGFPFVGLTGTCVDGYRQYQVDGRVFIPADEMLGIGETSFVLADFASLLV